MSIHNRPGPNAREKGLGLTLGVALVMGQALLLMPGQVAGQAQGRGEPTSVIDTVVDNAGLVPDRPTVRPTRTDTPPEIDGRLDDEVWKTAAVLTEFVQAAPLDGAPATEATEVYVAYDAGDSFWDTPPRQRAMRAWRAYVKPAPRRRVRDSSVPLAGRAARGRAGPGLGFSRDACQRSLSSLRRHL